MLLVPYYYMIPMRLLKNNPCRYAVYMEKTVGYLNFATKLQTKIVHNMFELLFSKNCTEHLPVSVKFVWQVFEASCLDNITKIGLIL